MYLRSNAHGLEPQECSDIKWEKGGGGEDKFEGGACWVEIVCQKKKVL